MPNILRGKISLGLIIFALISLASSVELQAQVCTGFPSILQLGSSKNPNRLCSPVTATLDYNIRFVSATPAGTLQIEYNWDDGSAPEVFNLPTGQTTYNHSRSHPFPTNSDCEFNVIITLIYNGVRCASTRQVQKVASWRTEAFNPTNGVRLISPTTGTRIHEVCAGADINVIFNDNTQFNCNQNYVHGAGPLPVETPNTEVRWQQIIYNTPIPGAKIPNIRVNNVPVTGGTGNDILASYRDPRTANGVYHMPSPVLVTTPRRATLPITAPGGFGAGFPVVGQEFEVTLRYWNFCNPYDDPAIPGGPSDPVNGDNAPVEQTAIIRIVAAPAAPSASTQAPQCRGTTPSAFSITGVPAGNIVSWYRNVPGTPDTQGTLISSGTSTSLPITSHPNWVNNSTPGVYKVWATYRPNVAGALNCQSPAVQITRTIRERPDVPVPSTPPPALVCNGSSFTVTMPAAATEPVGGATSYTWSGSTGVTTGATTANSQVFNVNVTFNPGETYVDRTITVNRRFTTSPNCQQSRTLTFRVFRPTVAGTPGNTPDVCESSPVGTIALSGHVGDILRWEVSKDGGAFATYTGPASGNSITPGLLTDGVYQFRAVVQNESGGPCSIATSPSETVTVSDDPNPATAGADQFLCGPLTSGPLGGSDPAPGTGTWTYVASLSSPSTTTPTISNPNDRNATITILAANAGSYVMRWTVTNGSCVSSDDMVVDFGAPVTADAGADKAYCGVSATLEGNVPTIGIGEWEVVSGPGGCITGACPQLNILNTSIATSQIELVGPFTYGAYTLRWTITSGGVACFSDNDEVTITFDEPVQITSSPDVAAGCIDPLALTPINLTANFGGGAVSGHWEIITSDADGTVTGAPDASNPATDSYTPTIDDYNIGGPILVKFIATPAATSSCPVVEDQVAISFNRKPVANGGPDIGNICSDQVQLNAEVPIPFNATGMWTSAVPGMQFISSLDGVTIDPTDPKAVAKGLQIGANTVTWTLTDVSGTCVSDPNDVVLTRVNPPAPINFNPVECEILPAGGLVVTNITLTNYEDDVTALNPIDRHITWYRDGAPPAGTPIPSPGDPQLSVADGQVYLARIRELSTNCTSDAIVTITVRPLAPAISAAAALCEDSPGSNIVTGINLNTAFFIDKVTGGAAGLDVQWYPSLVDAQNSTFQIIAPFDISGNRDVFAKVSYSAPTAAAPACPNFAELDLVINTFPPGGAILGDPTVCMGTSGQNINDLPIYTYQVTSTPGAKYNWTIPTGANEFVLFGGGGEDDFFVILKFPFAAAPPDLDISVMVELNSCASGPFNLTIDREAIPGSPVVIGPADVCENLAGQSYRINLPSATSDYLWNITKQSDDTPGGAFIIAGQGQDEAFVDFGNENVFLKVKEQNAVCSGPETIVPIAVNLLPRMLSNNPTICSDSPTGIEFQAEPLSVAINHYDILSVSSTAGINFVTPPAGPVAQNDVASTAIQGHIFENLGAVPLAVNYTVQPVAVNGNGLECAGPSRIMTVTVKPEPQLSPALNKDVCTEETTKVRLLSAANTFPADRFIINSINVPAGVTAVDPADLLVADGATLHNDDVIFDHAFVNTSGSNQIVAYTIIPHSTLLNCSGNPPTTVNILIHPRTTVTQVSNSPLCNGDLLDVDFSSPDNPDANFQWIIKSYSPNIILGGAAAGIGDVVDLPVSNSSQTIDGTIDIGVKGKNIPTEETAAGCDNPETLFTVTVIKSPRAFDLNDLTACSDAPGGNTFTSNLALLEPSVTPDNADPDTQIRWFTESPSSPTTTQILAPALNAYSMQSGIPVFVEVQTLSTTCTRVVQVRYTVNPNVSLDPAITQDITCFGNNNGEIRVEVASGTPSYSYRIKKDIDPGFSNPVNSPSPTFQFNNLNGGNYIVRVEDSKTCFAELTATVNEPPPLTVLIPTNPALKEITCFGGTDGEIQASASGGTAPYTYTLASNGVSEPSGIFGNLGSGSYVVQVTDNNGCQINGTATLNNPPPVIISTMAAAVNPLGFNLSCNNAADGEITFQLDGTGIGSGPNYTYELLLNNALHASQTIPGTNGSFTGLGTGNYQLIARDVNGCPSAPKFAVILNPQPFNAGIVGSSVSVCENVKPADLIQIAPPFGGLGQFDFEWQVSLDGVSWTAADPVGNNDKNATYAFDPAGLVYDAVNPKYYYRRQVITAPGVGSCPPGFSNIVEVTVNPTPVVATSGISPLCEGSNSGRAELQLAVGKYPVQYTYEIPGFGQFANNLGGDPTLLTPAVVFIPQAATQLGNDIQVLFTNIKDANGCSPVVPAPPVDIDIIQISAAFTLTPTEICSGNAATVEWTKDPNLNYSLSFGDGTVVTVPFGSGGLQTESRVFINNSTTQPNTYQVTLTASYFSDCTVSTFQQLKVNPTAIVNLLPGQQQLCSGEFFEVQDKSLGVTSARWLRDAHDGNPPVEVMPLGVPVPNFTDQVFSPDANTKLYTFIYEPLNGICPVPAQSFDVEVFGYSQAAFTVDTDQPVFGGPAEVRFTNTSSPLFVNAGNFTYTWDFGENGAIVTPFDPPNATIFDVDYLNKADKQVVLTATNTLLPRCKTSFTMAIDIIIPALNIGFNVVPRAACVPAIIQTQNNSSGVDRYLWRLIDPNGNETTSTLLQPEWTLSSPGTYTVRLSGGVDGDPTMVEATPITVQVFNIPDANFEVFLNQAIYIGTPVRVNNASTNADEFEWNMGDHPESENIHAPMPPVDYAYKSEGSYDITLTAYKNHGAFDQDGDGVLDGELVCSDKTVRTIFVKPGGTLKIPNAFTPHEGNSEGGGPTAGSTNDYFLPIMDGVEEFTMQIFDRWGTLIFESRNKNQGWSGHDRNGRLMPAGVYVYKIVLRLTDNSRTTKIGDVTLIR